MTFATFLSQKIERYIELRRSLGYAFDKQAGTLRAFAHHVERCRLDGPATRTMAQDFVLLFRGAANSRAVRHGVLRRFYEHLTLYDARTEALDCKAFHRSRAIPPPRIVSEQPCLRHRLTVRTMSSRVRGMTTPSGWMR